MRSLRFTVIIASVLALAAPRAARGQADQRWTAWLGCWAPDSGAVGGTGAGGVTCIVPVAHSSSVDVLTIVRGEITSRDRLTGTTAPHAIATQGCRGSETVTWSSTGRRAFLHSAYACTGGTRGTASSVYAMTARGEWLRASEVHAGDGSIVSVERLHEVAAPSAVPASVLRGIDRQRLAITTARAAAAAKITVPEVMDALAAVDSDVVRSWIVASDQSFDISSDEASRLAHGSVPVSVMQAMLGARDGAVASAPARDIDAYLSTPTYLPQTAYYVCPPGGCYAPAAPTTTNVYVPAPAPTVTYPSVYPYARYPYGYSYPIHRGGERRGEDFHRGGGRPPANPVPPRPRGPSGIRP
ncbi:MAG TPA: hypothetical protein VHB25_01615 [Gemmatimonadaceae bacterium]|nr:hypothetical protein [Gemmatimonadaceae bacterium]